ncbi:hypothetical protein [Lewinella sp. W8]|nr:hypothetical protein [Lewinella sp. W8]MTB53544.1 hypothetical protein [Lewinella sp. W8]
MALKVSDLLILLLLAAGFLALAYLADWVRKRVGASATHPTANAQEE